ncbi:ribosomal protein S5 domain 2-type protein [Paraphysoderma sedebokerense]|nr:ribosomal protein S5 domain 2-type protein [Paraphysoderma sedebokerense]
MPAISPSEIDYITKGVDLDVRSDGRSRVQYRDFIIETGLLANASGSCRVKLDQTDVLVGVKAEVDDVSAEGMTWSKKGRVMCTVDCSPSVTLGSSSRTTEDFTTSTSQLLTNLYNSPSTSLDLAQLLIIPNTTIWTIYIDVLVLADGGNLLDAIVLACKSALMNTRIPKTVVQEVGGQMEFEVSDDVAEMEQLTGAQNLPVCVTVNKISHRHIVDATPLEEACSTASLYVFVSPSGVLTLLQKSGRGSVEPSLMIEMIQSGRKIGNVLNKRLMEVLQKEQKWESEIMQQGGVVRKAGFFA